MFATSVTTFEPGDYGQKEWICGDAISRIATYRVIKRTPNLLTVMELYPSREVGPQTYAIMEDESGEYFIPEYAIGEVRPLRPERGVNK